MEINGIKQRWVDLISPLEVDEEKEFNESDRNRIASCISKIFHRKTLQRYKISKVEKGVIKVTRTV